VHVAGDRIDTLSDRALAAWRARHIGFVFQLYNLMPVLTAESNVELPLLLHKMTAAERKKRAQIALDIVGLSDRMGHYPRMLSGGQEQRVAIARAIVNDPKVIIGDEPTGDLDRNSADEILKLFEQLNRELGKTIIMVTHDPEAAERATVIRRLNKGVLA
jgi:putative ABC transport system ATP-binding protein